MNYLLRAILAWFRGGHPPTPFTTLFTVILLILLIILILIIIIVTGIARRFDAVIIVELILFIHVLLTSPLFSLLHRGHIAAPLLRLYLYDAQVSNGV